VFIIGGEENQIQCTREETTKCSHLPNVLESNTNKNNLLSYARVPPPPLEWWKIVIQIYIVSVIWNRNTHMNALCILFDWLRLSVLHINRSYEEPFSVTITT
jgi:hypothetical protein